MESEDTKQIHIYNNSIVNQGIITNTQQTISGANTINKNENKEAIDRIINTLIENKDELLQVLGNIEKNAGDMSSDIRSLYVEMTRAAIRIEDSDIFKENDTIKRILSNSANLMTICMGVLEFSSNPALLSAAGHIIQSIK